MDDGNELCAISSLQGNTIKEKGNYPCPFPAFFYLSDSGSPSTIAVSAGWEQDNGKYMVSQFLLPLLTKEEVFFLSWQNRCVIYLLKTLASGRSLLHLQIANLEEVSLYFMQSKQPSLIVSGWWLISKYRLDSRNSVVQKIKDDCYIWVTYWWILFTKLDIIFFSVHCLFTSWWTQRSYFLLMLLLHIIYHCISCMYVFSYG